MSALPLITSEEFAASGLLPHRFDEPADVLDQWRDFERLMYWHLYRIRLEAIGARADLMHLVRHMAASADKASNLASAAIVLALAEILVTVGPFLTGLQMAELGSILAKTSAPGVRYRHEGPWEAEISSKPRPGTVRPSASNVHPFPKVGLISHA